MADVPCHTPLTICYHATHYLPTLPVKNPGSSKLLINLPCSPHSPDSLAMAKHRPPAHLIIFTPSLHPYYHNTTNTTLQSLTTWQKDYIVLNPTPALANASTLSISHPILLQ